jgi:hypothetical protein
VTHDESKRRILARRARFIAGTLAGLAISAGSPNDARARDRDADADADAGDDASEPQVCLSIARPPAACDCIVGAAERDGDGASTTLALVASVLVARRRTRRS